jgi:predicted RNA-binding Zn-ribbon protein involved in translation (DUF1610 family)
VAKALQCPNCGHRHPLSEVADRSSFACVSCGQVLKVPAAYRRSPPEGARPVASSAAPPRPPAPPRSRDSTRTMDRGAVAAAAAAASAGGGAAAVAPTPPTPPGSLLGSPRSARRNAAASPVGSCLGRWARFLVWLVSIPVAFLIVIVPARLAHFITGANLVGVVAGTGMGRYLRLAVVTLIWAFVAAALVTLIVMMIERRRARPAGDAVRRRGGGNGSGPPSDGGVVRGGSAASRSSRSSGRPRQPVARS